MVITLGPTGLSRLEYTCTAGPSALSNYISCPLGKIRMSISSNTNDEEDDLMISDRLGLPHQYTQWSHPIMFAAAFLHCL